MNLDDNLSPAAQCWNYLVRTENILYCDIEKYMINANVEKPYVAAQNIYQEVKAHGLKRQSFRTFQEFFKPIQTEKQADIIPKKVVAQDTIKKSALVVAEMQEEFMQLNESLRDSMSRFRTKGKTKKIRDIKLLIRDKGICQLCLKEIKFMADFSADHKIPDSMGGTSRFDNLQSTHVWCNNHRGCIDLKFCHPEMFQHL